MATKKTNAKVVVPVEPELPVGNRYCRAARVCIEFGDDIDVDLLANKSDLSVSAARYALEAYKGVSRALREAGMLSPEPEAKAKPEPADTATEEGETATEQAA